MSQSGDKARVAVPQEPLFKAKYLRGDRDRREDKTIDREGEQL